MDISKIKPGQIFATTNTKGYEGKEVCVFLGFEFTRDLLYIQWIRGPLERVFTVDFEKTFYKTKLEGIVGQELRFKRKKLSTKSA